MLNIKKLLFRSISLPVILSERVYNCVLVQLVVVAMEWWNRRYFPHVPANGRL